MLAGLVKYGEIWRDMRWRDGGMEGGMEDLCGGGG